MDLSASPIALIDECLAREQAGDIADALRWVERELEKARASGQAEAIAAALVVAGRLRFRLGQYAAAQVLATEALGIAPARSPICADAWQVLANCAADTESLTQAEAYYRLAADVARETGYPRAQVAALHGLAAGVYFPRGKFDLALAAAAVWMVPPGLSAVAAARDEIDLRIASRDDIDLAMTHGMNYPKGLLAWADEIGIPDIVEHLDWLHAEYCEDLYRCCRLLRAGGRKPGDDDGGNERDDDHRHEEPPRIAAANGQQVTRTRRSVGWKTHVLCSCGVVHRTLPHRG